MSDNASTHSGQSSSSISRTSSESRNTKTMRGQPQRKSSKTSSKTTTHEDPSLTSFPSLSPEPAKKRPPKVQPNQPVERTVSQKAKQRKATLAGLVNASPAIGHQNALFDDSPRASLDIPGSLHLGTDDHIERLVARMGAVKLIRQYAQDLAQRDAELSALRTRADLRERELKRMLREADIATSEVEKRLLRIELGDEGDNSKHDRLSKTSLDGMMNEAMASRFDTGPPQPRNEIGLPLIGRPMSPTSPTESQSRRGSFKEAMRATAASSRTNSRANSVASLNSHDLDATLRARQSNANTAKASSLANVFQAPPQSNSYFIGGSKTVRKPKAADEASVRSNQSSQSFSSWRQIFGGKPQTGRARASSLEQGLDVQPTQSEAESAFASLTKVNTNPQTIGGRTKASMASNNTLKAKPTGRRTPTAAKLSTSPGHDRSNSNAGLPLTVELDSVLEPDSLPPTMTTQHNSANGVLTDRFGFIYDQKRRLKRQSLQVPRHRRNRLSGTETIASLRSEDISPPVDHLDRVPTPVSIEGDSSKKTWQDYLKPGVSTHSGRPKELLLHTPSAGAVVTVNTTDATGTLTPPRLASAEHGLHPTSTTLSEARSMPISATTKAPQSEREQSMETDSVPSRMLLEQLNDLHDTLQAERNARWNDFLRRIRAERATNVDSLSKNAPEADLLDGEIIGIASLGRRNKAKYAHFRALVLAGIPINLRPKIWGECSGATERRIPGYYEDLCFRADEGMDVDHDIANQISADIKRTLRDNVFFTTGPGVDRLDQVLRAYSLHNPIIGYCQGMNLIAASLLLICATPEDCFWLLVSIIDVILPSGYFSGSLLTARADQIVLRQYVADLLPALSAKLDELGVDLEASTFHWFLSMYAGVLTGGEALYRIWDIVLTLHSNEAISTSGDNRTLGVDFSALTSSAPSTPVTTTSAGKFDKSDHDHHEGTSSPFLFQLAISLLYLNQDQILGLESAAQVYTYLNHNCTSSAIPLNDLVAGTEALRGKIRRDEVVERRKVATKTLGG